MVELTVDRGELSAPATDALVPFCWKFLQTGGGTTPDNCKEIVFYKLSKNQKEILVLPKCI